MDVAFYLSELLGELGEVNVPGLGHFVQLRLDGYYNNEEAVFYPPGHKVGFDPRYIDDDILVQYIADKKNISLASSKYFTEKYINNIKQEALLKDVAIADLGWLYLDGMEIIFKPAEVLENDPAFYGYPPIKLNKSGDARAFEQPVSLGPEPIHTQGTEIISDTIPAPMPEEKTVEQPAEVSTPKLDIEEQEEFVFKGRRYSGEETRKRGRIWMIILLVVFIIAAGGVFGLYTYKPAIFDRLMGISLVPVKLKPYTVKKNEKTPVKQDTINDTTAKGLSAVKDTTAKAVTTAAPVNNQPAAVIDSSKTRYEVIGTSAATRKEANKYIKNYKSEGIEAYIVNDAPGRRLKISLGTYNNNAEATAKEKELLKSRKIQKDIWILKINPKR